jgi:diguanylate cyclase (GGDEF)-like protein
MSEPRPIPRTAAEFEADFRQSRIETLISVNLNTFWATVIIVLAFGLWDVYADATNWSRAFIVRLIAAAIVVATGVYQKLPGRQPSLPLMAKIRLVVAALASIIAAAMLDRGYGFGVAGLVAILLTGPYITIDSRDLLKTNLVGLAAVAIAMLVMRPIPFDIAGTAVFVVLAVVVSTLLGSVLEASNRRAFTLELTQHRDARTDSLTGLANRREIQERGRVEVKRARRTGTAVSVILGDLDHFKNINDRHGHEAGDAALVQTASILKAALRESDALGRWGGEEFIAVLPGTEIAGARAVAERMRVTIASASFTGIPDKITISLGVATSENIEDHEMEWDLLVKEADRRLYQAKHDGRNRVVSTIT